MREQNNDILKGVLEAVPPGFLVDSRWLAKHKVGRSSVHSYKQRGWLEHVAHGVYRRPYQLGKEREVIQDWEIVVLSLQRIMDYELHVGGMTALKLHGHAHYLSMGGNETVFLYGNEIPGWLQKLPTRARFEMRNCNLFDSSTTGLDEITSKPGGQEETSPWWRWSMISSSPERAILEAIDELPDEQSFHTIDTAFEGLVNLSPRKLMVLLKACKKIKVVRLFFVFADRHNHAWRRHLDKKEINFGSGDRSLVKGGKLHPVYRITVPPEFVASYKDDADGS